MPKSSLRRVARAGARRSQRGSVLPVVLALAVGVGALASGFAAQNLREHQRERWERNRQQAYFDAWSQLESVVSIVNTSNYDTAQRNRAILDAMAAGGEFVDRDGRGTGVVVRQEGALGSGFFSLISTANVEDARSRVSALVRERQSFADFNWFVERHDLGYAGGETTATAPRGSIHTNQELQFYFADRHFVDPVTASDGFSFTAGATPENTRFHDLFSSASSPVTGLTEARPADFATRADCVLALTASDDYAKIRLAGTEVIVEHWKKSRWEQQLLDQQYAVYRNETRQRELLRTIQVQQTSTVPVYETRMEWQTFPVTRQVLVTAGYWTTVTETVQVPVQVWIVDTATGSGSGDGAVAGGGATGHWETQYQTQTQTRDVYTAPVYTTVNDTEQRQVAVTTQTGTQQVTQTVNQQVPYDPRRYEDYVVSVVDHYETRQVLTNVYIGAALVATRTVPADGTIYVRGDVELVPVTGTGIQGVHYLQGSLTIATDGRIKIQDSIVYAAPDAGGTLQPRYLNGDNSSQNYAENPAYTGNAVLGLISTGDILLESTLPNHAEINAAMLSRDGGVKIRGVTVNADGSVATNTNGNFVSQSLRRLGSVISATRPVTAFVDANNTVTRGFRTGRSVYDLRLRTAPPRGFPTLGRPTVVAQVVGGREVD